MTIISLKEYETFPSKKKILDQDDPRTKDLEKIRFEEKDSKLQEELQKKDILSISSDPFHKYLKFSAKSHIGVAQFSNFSVAITPKFSEIGKVVELINYVYELDLEIFPDSEVHFEGEKNILTEIIISTFVKKCQKLIRQGLFKSYIPIEDNVSFLRGKLLISQQILNQAKTKLQFACEYDEFEFNNIENQIVLFCLEQSYYLTINDKRKKEIRKIIQNFSSLVSHKKISLDDFKKINYNQMNYHYRKIHELCKLIINSTQIIDLYKQKTRFVNSFFVNMNDVFEKFVFKLFYQYYPYPAKEQQYYPSFVTERDGTKIPTYTDILIYDKDRITVRDIIDTKYRADISDTVYQLTFYARDYGKNFIYAILPEFSGARPDIITATRQNIQIKIRHLNIDKALEYIALSDSKLQKEKLRDMLTNIVPIN